MTNSLFAVVVCQAFQISNLIREYTEVVRKVLLMSSSQLKMLQQTNGDQQQQHNQCSAALTGNQPLPTSIMQQQQRTLVSTANL